MEVQTMKLTAIEKKILYAFGSPFLKDTLKRLDTLFYAAWNDETKIVIRHLMNKLKAHFDDSSYAEWHLSYQLEKDYPSIGRRKF